MVAVMNTSYEVTEMIKTIFEASGYDVCDIFTYKLKYGEIKFDDFLNKYKPDVIIYDIAIPYEENYLLFLALAKKMAEKKIPFVLTTTNKKVLDDIVAETNAYEIIGKPYDLDNLVELVERALKNKQAINA